MNKFRHSCCVYPAPKLATTPLQSTKGTTRMFITFETLDTQMQLVFGHQIRHDIHSKIFVVSVTLADMHMTVFVTLADMYMTVSVTLADMYMTCVHEHLAATYMYCTYSVQERVLLLRYSGTRAKIIRKAIEAFPIAIRTARITHMYTVQYIFS